MTDRFWDPVCGIDVTAESATGKSEFDGNTYCFYSLSCKESLDRQSGA